MEDYILAPYFSLKPNAITLYEQPEPARYFAGSRKGFENLKNNENKYGEISAHSVKRLRKVIDYMLYLSKEQVLRSKRTISKSNLETIEFEKGDKYSSNVKYKLTFVTLTLPSSQIHTDNELKSKCLNHFLIVLKQKFEVDLYIWKAEKQENGNIHFHILTNKFIDWKDLRTEWNRIINKLGYVDRYQQKMKEFYKNGFRLSDNILDKRSEASQRRAYDENLKNDFKNPNSTDIHALYKIRNVSAYISKYLSKEVTKTERIIKIDSVNEAIKQANCEYDTLNAKRYNFLTFQPEYIDVTEQMKKQELLLFSLKEQKAVLKAQGVEGRIWGCSSLLSKCKNFTDLCPHDQIPQIDKIIQKNTGIFKNSIGSREVTTYTFNISEFPELNRLLKNHVLNLLNDKDAFSLKTS